MVRKHEGSERSYRAELKFGLAFFLLLLAILLATGCACKEDEGTRSDVKQLVCAG